MNKIKRLEISDSKTSDTVRNAFANVPGQVGAPLSNLQSLYRTVQRTRKHEDVVKNVKNLASMAIPHVLRRTLKGEEFLLYDSVNGSKRFLMYSTHDKLKNSEKCKIRFAYGSFKCVPVIFEQLSRIC